MSLKLQPTSGTSGSGSGRRIGPASKTNRLPSANEVIDVDALDEKPLSQMINQKPNEIKAEMKKSLIPISTNEKNNQVTLSTTAPTSSPSSDTKHSKESNPTTPSTTNDKKDNSKNSDKNGHKNDETKISTAPPLQKESKTTNGHQNDDGNIKNLMKSPTNGNEEQKDSITKEQKSKIPTIDEQSTISTATVESEKSGTKSKKNSEKEKKKANEEMITTNIDVLPQPTIAPPLKRTSQRAAAIQANASLSSLANEKELKGFNEVGDEEMDSILLQIDTSEQVEKPTRSYLTPTKLISSNVEKKSEQENSKIDDFVQLSTNKSPIKITIPFSKPPITSTPDVKQQYSYLPRPLSSSVRSISGRRSLRPLNKEYSFQNTTNYRESYRQTEFDCTGNTSLNVTVGSEIAQPEFTSSSSSSSFSFFGRGKKREHTTSQQQSITEKSPEHFELINDDNELNTSVSKRARLDFSGFFGIVASPVTMLRARLARAKIQSTPILNDDVEEGVENFSGSIGEKNNDSILDNKGNCKDEDVENDEIRMKDENEKNVKDVSEATVASEDNEIIVTEYENKRRMCLLM